MSDESATVKMANKGGNGAPLVSLEAVARPQLSQSEVLCVLFKSGVAVRTELKPENFKPPESEAVNKPGAAPPAKITPCNAELANKKELPLDKRSLFNVPSSSSPQSICQPLEGCDNNLKGMPSLRGLPPLKMPVQLVPSESSEKEFQRSAQIKDNVKIESCLSKTEKACSHEQLETKKDVEADEAPASCFKTNSCAGKETDKCDVSQLVDQRQNVNNTESLIDNIKNDEPGNSEKSPEGIASCQQDEPNPEIAKFLKDISVKDEAVVPVVDETAGDTKKILTDIEHLNTVFVCDADTVSLNSPAEKEYLKAKHFIDMNNKSKLENKNALEATAHLLADCFSEKKDNVKDVNKIGLKKALLNNILLKHSLRVQTKGNGIGASSEPQRMESATETGKITESGNNTVSKELLATCTTAKTKNVDLCGVSAPFDKMSADSQFYINLINDSPSQETKTTNDAETQTTNCLAKGLIPPKVRHIDFPTHTWYEVIVYPESFQSNDNNECVHHLIRDEPSD